MIAAINDDKNEFIEGLAFSEHEAVIMTGQLTDDAETDKVFAKDCKYSIVLLQGHQHTGDQAARRPCILC